MKLLITGASGTLGSRLMKLAPSWFNEVVGWTHRQTSEQANCHAVELSDRRSIADAWAACVPDVVIHAGAMASVSACHADPKSADMVNTQATTQLAECCANHGSRLIFTSTDLVFDGSQGQYQETDSPSPLSIYGRSKANAEKGVLRYSRCLIARCSLLIGRGPAGRPNFFDQQVNDLKVGKCITLFHDEWRTPLSVQDAAMALLALASSNAEGIVHLAGPECMSRVEVGRLMCEVLQVPFSLIREASREEMLAPEPRPCDVSLRRNEQSRIVEHRIRPIPLSMQDELLEIGS